VGSHGDSYDNVLAAALNSLFKTECIRNSVMRPTGGWKSVGDVETDVAEYIDWFNHRRPHGELKHVPPDQQVTFWYVDFRQTSGRARRHDGAAAARQGEVMAARFARANPALARAVTPVATRVARVYGGAVGVLLTAARRAGFPRLPGPASTIGLLAGAHVLALTFWLGPIGVVASAAAGSIAAAAIAWRVRSRPLDRYERAIAVQVFGDADWLDDVRLTSISVQNGRAFAFPGADGHTYLNLGRKGFAAPLDGNRLYPAIGQILVHELVHAWQIAHAPSLAAFLSHAADVQIRNELGDQVYRIGEDPVVWADCNLEQQATAVDRWYAGRRSATNRQMDPDGTDAATITAALHRNL
jgi:hypothetical protein